MEEKVKDSLPKTWVTLSILLRLDRVTHGKSTWIVLPILLDLETSYQISFLIHFPMCILHIEILLQNYNPLVNFPCLQGQSLVANFFFFQENAY